MDTTLATKSDLLLIRQEMENRFSLASRDIDSLRKGIESLGASSRHELESLRESCLATLAEFRRQLGLKVYAYCLTTNHVYLIIDPRSDAANLSLLMKHQVTNGPIEAPDVNPPPRD